jgi:peptidoglycan hydrolase CwlO-like protein
MVCALVVAEDKPKPATPAAGAIENKDVQILLLRAQRDLSSAQADMANLESQFQSLQSQMNGLRAQAPAAQQKVAAAQAALQKEKDEAIKGIGLDPAKYDLDEKTFIASPKVAPAAPTPSPEKK